MKSSPTREKKGENMSGSLKMFKKYGEMIAGENPFIKKGEGAENNGGGRMNEIINKKPEELTAEDAERICEALWPIVQAIGRGLWPIALKMAVFLKNYPNKRVIYLAARGKKRAKKKNIHRIIDDFTKALF